MANRIFTILTMMLLSCEVFAVGCKGLVSDILIDSRIMVYIEGQGWNKLGDSNNAAIGPKLSLLLSAEARNKEIILNYNDPTYNCSAGWNATESATFIKMLK